MGSTAPPTSCGWPGRCRVALLPAKLLTEVTLLVVGFEVQRHFVFARRHPTS